MPDVGDKVTASLAVSPHAGDTQASLTVTAPDGTTSTPSVSTADGGATWTAPLTYTAAGVWLLHWVVTGTGASAENQQVSVAPTPGAGATGRVYATTTDLANYLRAAPPTGAAGLLADATRMLEARLLAFCRYDVDDDGMPTDEAVAAAIARAVCAQVAWWDEVGDSRGAVGAGYDSVSIGSVSLGRSGTGVSGDDSAARQIAPQVMDELRAPDLHDKLFIGALAVPW
ncbi:hypothetical protein [Streptomyces spinosisporus]|uniref:Bacterial Ig-like domain-containing protein n=1 Tax=Streptomyces spinosisporus TaxID=2927582 RepID=A0ABS9XDX0_9ACTN|nr:hypothetical protein [Streptomyces spinosisporus]MCI3240293.1 hypothetical protein [Streptomyces spinosisporus]